MSCSNSLLSERRLSTNGKNAYIVLSPLNNNNNLYDTQKNRNYLTAKTTNERSPLSSAITSAPNCVEYSTKENQKYKQTTSLMVDEKSSTQLNDNSNNNYYNINTVNTISGNKSDLAKDNSEIISPSRQSMKNTGAIPKNNNNLVNSGHNKIPTGMDRYITITKRKSSPRTLKLEPNPKQQKKNEVSQNRFSILDNQESEVESAKSTKNYKPPPLYLREPTTNALVKKLSQLVGKENFYVVSLRKGNVSETKIQTFTEKNYRIIVDCFDSEKRNYYTYQLKSAKGLLVVIKGIDSSVPADEIKEALESEGYEVKSVHNIINKNKVPQPIFRVEISYNSSRLKKKSDTHPIYGLRYLLNRKIVVEEPIKRKGPPQCLNCQEYGHTKSFCKLPSVCVRCGDIHKSLECPHSKTDISARKCSNCGQNHTANYRGCPVYIQIKGTSKARRPVYAQYQDSNFPSLPNGPTSSAQHRSNLNTNRQLSYAHTVKEGSTTQMKLNVEGNAQFPNTFNKGSVIPNQTHKNNENNAPLFSYAHALKEGSVIPNINSQSSIEKLIETMNSFMSNMQNMLQQLMQNQSMLMQILLSKK